MNKILTLFGPALAYAAFITVPTSTPTDLSAQMTSQFADVGFLAVVVLAAGIPLTFYVIKKLVGLIPKR